MMIRRIVRGFCTSNSSTSTTSQLYLLSQALTSPQQPKPSSLTKSTPSSSTPLLSIISEAVMHPRGLEMIEDARASLDEWMLAIRSTLKADVPPRLWQAVIDRCKKEITETDCKDAKAVMASCRALLVLWQRGEVGLTFVRKFITSTLKPSPLLTSTTTHSLILIHVMRIAGEKKEWPNPSEVEIGKSAWEWSIILDEIRSLDNKVRQREWIDRLGGEAAPRSESESELRNIITELVWLQPPRKSRLLRELEPHLSPVHRLWLLPNPATLDPKSGDKKTIVAQISTQIITELKSLDLEKVSAPELGMLAVWADKNNRKDWLERAVKEIERRTVDGYRWQNGLEIRALESVLQLLPFVSQKVQTSFLNAISLTLSRLIPENRLNIPTAAILIPLLSKLPDAPPKLIGQLQFIPANKIRYGQNRLEDDQYLKSLMKFYNETKLGSRTLKQAINQHLDRQPKSSVLKTIEQFFSRKKAKIRVEHLQQKGKERKEREKEEKMQDGGSEDGKSG